MGIEGGRRVNRDRKQPFFSSQHSLSSEDPQNKLTCVTLRIVENNVVINQSTVYNISTDTTEKRYTYSKKPGKFETTRTHQRHLLLRHPSTLQRWAINLLLRITRGQRQFESSVCESFQRRYLKLNGLRKKLKVIRSQSALE